MKKYIIGSLLALTLFVGVVRAETVDNTELLNRLLKQLAELTVIVQKLQAQQNMQGPAYQFKGDAYINSQPPIDIDHRTFNTSSRKPTISGYTHDISEIGISIGDSGGKAWGSGKIKVTNGRWSVFVDHEFDPGKYPVTITDYSNNKFLGKYTLTILSQGVVDNGSIIISSDPNEPLRIITNKTINSRSVVVLPGKEESLFAVGVGVNKSIYANALEVRFDKVSGSGFLSDYVEKVTLVDQFNRPISSEGGVSYDGNTTVYKFTKLAYKIPSYGENFYIRIKAKSDMDKAGKFTMSVPKDGLRIGDSSYASGSITNTITFDPTYTLQKAETTVNDSHIKILTQNNGDKYKIGDTLEIKYETNLNNTNSYGIAIDLYKYKDIPGYRYEYVSSIAAGLKDGKYTWTIPNTIAPGQYVIFAVGQGVRAEGSSIADFTDKPFTIDN